MSFDNSKTLNQKATFANGKCLGGLFSWALDLGGPGSKENPNELDPSDTSMDGANTDGGSDGTGNFYVGQEIFTNHTVVGIAPINMIMPPSTLGSVTTIYPGPFTTSLEFACTTTATVTISSQVTVTTGISRTIKTTTISLDPIVTTEIPWWNWNLTSQDATSGTTVLFPSFTIPAIQITENPYCSGSPTTTSSRTLVVPPWPWATTPLATTIPTGPIIHFTQGDPPSPTCTTGCGTKCTSFCDAPCMDDCADSGGGSSSGFEDPSDPDPPSHEKCSGPDCKNGKCDGPLCVIFGCTGTDCDENSAICLGTDCEETGCIGDGCNDGSCTSTPCITKGCSGDDCNGSGFCLGLECISLGCIGLGCEPDGLCVSYDCHKVSCTGTNCDNGVCKGQGCEVEDSDCESEEADVCTEYISSWIETSDLTYTTTTSTSCDTVTACYAEATTTTSTLSDETSTWATPFKAYALETDAAYITSVASGIDEYMASVEGSYYSVDNPTTSATTSSETTSSKASTATGPAATSLDDTTPDEVSYSCRGMSERCGTFSGLRAFCDVAKSYLRGDDIYGYGYTSPSMILQTY